MNKKWNYIALNCNAYSYFEGKSSDHHIVLANVRLSIHRNVTQTLEPEQYDWSLFNNKGISDKYTITIGNKFDAL